MNKTITLLLFLLFFISSLILTELWSDSRIILYLFISLFFIIPLFRYKSEVEIDYKTFIIMCLFIFFSGISALMNTEYELLITSFMFFLLYYASFIISTTIRNVDVNKIIYRTIFMSHIFILIVPILFNGIDSNPYKGLFQNSNALGNTAAVLFTIVFSVILYGIEENVIKLKKKKNSHLKLFLNILFLISAFYLVVLSASRTSFLSVIIVILIGVFYLVIYLIKTKKISTLIRGSILAIFFIIVVTPIVKYTALNDLLQFNIVQKFQRKASEGDVLDTRGQIWLRTIEDARLFGNGSNYFNEFFGLSAHNTFIEILGKFGWVPFIIFVIFTLTVLIYAIRFSLENFENQYKYMPLLLSICFITLSMGEVIIFRSAMLAMFLSVGITANTTRVINKNKTSNYMVHLNNKSKI